MSDYPQVQFSLFEEEEASLNVLPQVVTGCEYPEIDQGRAEDNIKGGNCPPTDVDELVSWYRSVGGKWAEKAKSSSGATGFTQIGGDWVFTFPSDDQGKEQGHPPKSRRGH